MVNPKAEIIHNKGERCYWSLDDRGSGKLSCDGEKVADVKGFDGGKRFAVTAVASDKVTIVDGETTGAVLVREGGREGIRVTPFEDIDVLRESLSGKELRLKRWEVEGKYGPGVDEASDLRHAGEVGVIVVLGLTAREQYLTEGVPARVTLESEAVPLEQQPKPKKPITIKAPRKVTVRKAVVTVEADKLFEKGSAEIKDDSDLRRLVSELKKEYGEDQIIKIFITGTTDSADDAELDQPEAGGFPGNKVLSELRAKAIAGRLFKIAEGTDLRFLVHHRGLGEYHPRVKEVNLEGRAKFPSRLKFAVLDEGLRLNLPKGFEAEDKGKYYKYDAGRDRYVKVGRYRSATHLLFYYNGRAYLENLQENRAADVVHEAVYEEDRTKRPEGFEGTIISPALKRQGFEPKTAADIMDNITAGPLMSEVLVEGMLPPEIGGGRALLLPIEKRLMIGLTRGGDDEREAYRLILRDMIGRVKDSPAITVLINIHPDGKAEEITAKIGKFVKAGLDPDQMDKVQVVVKRNEYKPNSVTIVGFKDPFVDITVENAETTGRFLKFWFEKLGNQPGVKATYPGLK